MIVVAVVEVAVDVVALAVTSFLGSVSLLNSLVTVSSWTQATTSRSEPTQANPEQTRALNLVQVHRPSSIQELQ